ncbi:hypothetical protein ACFU99_16730 [Streptomyces sp. NPDC057654]|uniref:hypothetical protein n=1 Tax=Streptomyces sp. NPDC057654 TaxID=3346196 RepID=UPI0036BDEC6C
MADDRLVKITARKAVAGPHACGTCRTRACGGMTVEHDECAARATLLEAPEQPDYEDLVDLADAERAALPARFHTPTFDNLGKPNMWLCRVCWGDGWVTQWPCATALKHGDQVFTPEHLSVQEQCEQADRLLRARSIPIELENENARLAAELEKYVGKEPTLAEETAHLSNCLDAVHCDKARQTSRRREQSLPEPEWGSAVEHAASGERPADPDDIRRRIYIDGTGHAWLDQPLDDDRTHWIAPLAGAMPAEAEPAAAVRARTGTLREIGRIR